MLATKIHPHYHETSCTCNCTVRWKRSPKTCKWGLVQKTTLSVGMNVSFFVFTNWRLVQRITLQSLYQSWDWLQQTPVTLNSRPGEQRNNAPKTWKFINRHWLLACPNFNHLSEMTVNFLPFAASARWTKWSSFCTAWSLATWSTSWLWVFTAAVQLNM